MIRSRINPNVRGFGARESQHTSHRHGGANLLGMHDQLPRHAGTRRIRPMEEPGLLERLFGWMR